MEVYHHRDEVLCARVSEFGHSTELIEVQKLLGATPRTHPSVEQRPRAEGALTAVRC